MKTKWLTSASKNIKSPFAKWKDENLENSQVRVARMRKICLNFNLKNISSEMNKNIPLVTMKHNKIFQKTQEEILRKDNIYVQQL